MKKLLALITLVVMAAFTLVMTPEPAEASGVVCSFTLYYPGQQAVCANLNPSIGQFITYYSNRSVNDVKVRVDAGSCQGDVRTIPKLTEDVPQSYQCGNVTGAIFSQLGPQGQVQAQVAQ